MGVFNGQWHPLSLERCWSCRQVFLPPLLSHSQWSCPLILRTGVREPRTPANPSHDRRIPQRPAPLPCRRQFRRKRLSRPRPQAERPTPALRGPNLLPGAFHHPRRRRPPAPGQLSHRTQPWPHLLASMPPDRARGRRSGWTCRNSCSSGVGWACRSLEPQRSGNSSGCGAAPDAVKCVTSTRCRTHSFRLSAAHGANLYHEPHFCRICH